MIKVNSICKKAKSASYELACLDTNKKNEILKAMADAILNNEERIVSENKKDLDLGRENGLSEALIDRLTLNKGRIESMAEGLRVMADIKDPIGDIVSGWVNTDGLDITKVRVPIGVIAMIFESRPNVTVDAAGLALKSGNAIILRGGKEAINSNMVLADIIIEAGENVGMPKGSIELIRDINRELVTELITTEEYVDVIIPRGGVGLKKAIVKNATVPMIVTGAGNCHVYVDSSADIKMATDIIINAKTQRTGVCNAAETLLIHKDLSEKDIKNIIIALKLKNVVIHGCSNVRKIDDSIIEANESDWENEYLALEIAIKIVSDIDEAIDHINKYGTKHSESIVTKDVFAAERFLNRVDASTVYSNASTRFTDGSVFGFGGEIGISTQKLHARGPMGLYELTTTKYKVRGKGHIR
jgi:glutamate-5-semialdehyde dehydrogenase